MWYVIKPNGEQERVHNKATAIYFAKKYGTGYVDRWSNRVFKAGA